MIKVLFVCLGNICRSPSADAVLRKKVIDAGLSELVQVDSAGTAHWHAGEAPDARSIAAGQKRGYDLAVLRARQVTAADFEQFDYILAMDSQNLADLTAIRPSQAKTSALLFLAEFGHTGHQNVPDPYYGKAKDFELVLDLLEPACDALLSDIRQHLGAQ